MRQAILANVLVALALPLLVCGPASALVGADIADRTVQRYTVLVASAKGRCSGVVLAQNVVLTAAHCVQGTSNLQVGGNLGGGYQTLRPSALSPVIETVQHPLYRLTDAGSPDLAILKLAKPLPDRFIPAVLNPRYLKIGDDLIAAGYGKSAANDAKAGTVLRMVLLRVSQTIKGWVILVRVGEDASGAGPGDSGGPVFAYRGMHSLVALIVGVSQDRTRAVALASHYGWIKETVEKLSAP
jgi:hypothetical protein